MISSKEEVVSSVITGTGLAAASKSSVASNRELNGLSLLEISPLNSQGFSETF